MNMSERRMRIVGAIALLALIFGPGAGPVRAAEICWDKGSTDFSPVIDPPYPGNGLWNTAANWRANNNTPHTPPNNDVLPSPGDRANIALHNLWPEVDAPCTIAAGDNITVSSIRLGTNPGIGVGGHGKLIIEDGALTVKDTGTGDHFRIGADSNRTGHLIMNAGTLTVDDSNRRLILGNGANTNTVGIVEFYGGTITANGGLFIAGDDQNANRQNTQGTFTMGTLGDPLTAQTLNTQGANMEVGYGGTGAFTQNSGTVNVNASNLIVSQGTQAEGTYTMNGGLLDTYNQLRVGNKGVGVFVQNGGTVNVGTVLDLANDAANDADATYTMNGGVLNVGDRTNNSLKIGNANRSGSTALFELIDGDVDVSTNVRIADNGGNSSGKLIIGNGTTTPTLTCNHFETADNGTGELEMNSGTLTLDGGNFITGQAAGSEATATIGGSAGLATIDLTGGDGNRDWNTNTGHGVVSVLAGGTINVGRDINMGNNADANSGLELTINGGTVNVGTAKPAGTRKIDYRNNGPKDQINLVDGVLNLNGGNIVFTGAAAAQFSFTGGTLLNVGTFGSTLNQNGGTLAPGASPGTTNVTGDYHLNAGDLEIEINALLNQGQDPGYDFVDVSGYADLDSFLKVVLLGGYLPNEQDIFDVLTATDITLGPNFVLSPPAGLQGAFAAHVIPGGNGEILRLKFVPEPITMLLAAAGLAGLGGYLRRRRRA